MKRYWVIAPSKKDPYHWADGRVVLVKANIQEAFDLHEDAETLLVRAYDMDLNKESTNFLIDPNALAPWHLHNPNHRHCYCLRK